MSTLVVRRPRWPAIALALVLGAIIHIVATLAVPHIAATTAYRRLSGNLPVNEMRLLARPTPSGQSFPFQSPDVRVAVCRFDIGNAPLSVSAVLPERGWTLTIYSRHGDSVHAIAAQEERSTDIGFRLVQAPEPSLLSMITGGRPVATDTTQVNSPVRDGLIVIRAPVRSASFLPAVEAVLGAARCEPEAQ
ncbi:MAG TPA: hypothetical protein PK264_22540 [Hyphomicrobiaceae bacterium]|nr:hypothetical protein [Hyphomicrobiaceae bacterium]